ncbi:MAG: endonuclease/exonuclease/phosphatase family protein [Cyanobacteria bacterium J06597_1]
MKGDVVVELRIATFNIENLEFDADSTNPPLAQRIPLLRSQLNQLNADVLCLQEIHGQLDESSGKRRFLALQELLVDTQYSDYQALGTHDPDGGPGQALDYRNVVTLSRFPITHAQQYYNDLVQMPFRQNTALPKTAALGEPDEIAWHRPFLHVELELPNRTSLHVMNLHLKSPLPSEIEGQRADDGAWQSLAGRAESELLSDIKRAGQALEVRILVDRIFERDSKAAIVVCGDFNAEIDDLPVRTIVGRFSRVHNPQLVGQELAACEQLVSDEQRFTHLYAGRRTTIDHLLASRSLYQKLSSCHIFNQNLHDSANPDRQNLKFPDSDHAALLTVFQI